MREIFAVIFVSNKDVLLENLRSNGFDQSILGFCHSVPNFKSRPTILESSLTIQHGSSIGHIQHFALEKAYMSIMEVPSTLNLLTYIQVNPSTLSKPRPSTHTHSIYTLTFLPNPLHSRHQNRTPTHIQPTHSPFAKPSTLSAPKTYTHTRSTYTLTFLPAPLPSRNRDPPPTHIQTTSYSTLSKPKPSSHTHST